ncbi:MAG: TetR family transcriptional regulator [Burkholderiales bacterium RIFCSPLOWO2_02_FULL_57_36]|nr:MAG: TetR family transcriptional regulator [Burkholderiales bacterium RIFCSPLOWO2_02_FULL_57_36]
MARPSGKTDIPRRLTAAGRELFMLHGYNATGIQQVTDLAGVPKGSFYNHFDSKESFAAVIIDQYADQMQRNWERMIEAAPPQPLASIAYAFEQMISHNERTASGKGCLVGNFAAEMAESSELCRQCLAAAMAVWRTSLTNLIRDAQNLGEVNRGIEATRLAALVWDVWEGALLRMKIEQSVAPLRESVDLILNHFLRAAPAPAALINPTIE